MPKPSESSTKFIERNRAPRVHIEYELDVNGAQKKVELPFVMGVMSDLSGKAVEPLPPVKDRKFLEFDMDNFDDRMKAIKPRVAFSVPDLISGEEGSNMAVDVTFESMDDFSPEKVVKKIKPLNDLLEARTQLSSLLSYMDGRTQAEDLMDKLISDPSLMKTVLSTPKPAAPAEDAAKQ
jgi:type VI secretion system protein ImpB